MGADKETMAKVKTDEDTDIANAFGWWTNAAPVQFLHQSDLVSADGIYHGAKCWTMKHF